MTREENLFIRQQQFDQTLEALSTSEGDIAEQVCLLDSAVCDYPPEALLEYRKLSKPAKAAPEQLALLEGVVASTTDESLTADLRDIIVTLQNPHQAWVDQLVTQAMAQDFISEIAEVIGIVKDHMNEHENSSSYSPDAESRRTLETLLDELVAITCPRRHEDGDLTAYLSEDDYEWLIEQRFILEVAGIETGDHSDYEIVLANADEAGFLEDQMDLELAIVD